MSAGKKLLAMGELILSTSYVDDVFSALLYDGNGAARTLTDNIDRSVGALDIFKSRASAAWAWYDTVRGVQNDLESNSTAAQTVQAQGVTSFGVNGVNIGTLSKINTAGVKYIKYTHKKADKFFHPQVVSHTNGVADIVDLSLLGTVGMVIVKRFDGTGDWLVWHRSQTAGKLTYLNQTAIETTDASISVAGTNLTLAAALATGNYVVEAWAHDPAADGIVQCGSFTTDASGNATVTLGWEPQLTQLKSLTSVASWGLVDSLRGMALLEDQALNPNATGAEVSVAWLKPSATGFTIQGYLASQTIAYKVIRRPNKPPTSGTSVYSPNASNAAQDTPIGTGFPIDLQLTCARAGTFGHLLLSRLRGVNTVQAATVKPILATANANAEDTASFATTNDWNSSGFKVPGTYNSVSTIYHSFRRAPGFLEEVCDTGTGAAHTVAHNLGVAPELLIRKGRSGATDWQVWHKALANTEKLVLNSTAAKTTDANAWNSTTPGATSFTVGTGANVNTNTATYDTIVAATLAGVSKVDSYTGNGTTLTINCGFASGARFVLIKRVDLAGDWYVWDAARGIIAGNDPHLSLNTTAAEVTGDDSIDPDSTGFIVNQLAATNINVVGGTYIYWAIA